MTDRFLHEHTAAPGHATNAAREETPVDTALLRAAFTQAQAQIMNNGQFEPVVVISKSLALQLLDEIDSLRVVR
jgi:hypothetical protein